MLKGANEFNLLGLENKKFQPEASAVKNEDADRWILTQWENTFNPWGNPEVPCIHADPQFPDCAPGDTVRLHGRLWFYEVSDLEDN